MAYLLQRYAPLFVDKKKAVVCYEDLPQIHEVRVGGLHKGLQGKHIAHDIEFLDVTHRRPLSEVNGTDSTPCWL